VKDVLCHGLPVLPTMMYTVLLALSVAWSGVFASADPVCIVGAGPAGLTIANRLQTKGLQTVIFEKNPEVGGKCQAYYDDK
jgi:NADPH-dependent 2,4-dienoyl-CoA reductase/sulfur reductase-like enzyme